MESRLFVHNDSFSVSYSPCHSVTVAAHCGCTFESSTTGASAAVKVCVEGSVFVTPTKKAR